jgi:AhpD family alkylhydroperoxidase
MGTPPVAGPRSGLDVKETIMEPRMKHPVFVLPGAYKGLNAMAEAAKSTGIDENLMELVHLRASQINGCAVCLHMHAAALQKNGESYERVLGVAAWRDSPFYSDAERVALELTEELTRIADRGEAVSDELWTAATKHFDEEQLSALLISISAINVWNRLNAATRQVAGAY